MLYTSQLSKNSILQSAFVRPFTAITKNIKNAQNGGIVIEILRCDSCYGNGEAMDWEVLTLPHADSLGMASTFAQCYVCSR